jgi:hypothetical protein
VRVKLRRGIAIHGTRRIVLERSCKELARRFRRMNIADTRLCVPLQFVQSNTHTFTMCFPHAKIAINKRSQRNRLWRGKSRIPPSTVLNARNLLAILVLVGSRRLVLDKLCTALWMLALA